MDKEAYEQERDGFIININRYSNSNLKNVDDYYIDRYLQALDRLVAKYPEESSTDAQIDLIYFRIYTKDYTDYRHIKSVFASNHFSELYKSFKKRLTLEDRKFTGKSVMADKFETYINRYLKRKGQKKGWRVLGGFFGLVLAAAIVISFVSPSIFPFYKHKIIYNVDNVEYTADVIFNKEYKIEIPNKIGYKFLGLYESANVGAKQVVNENGESIGKYNSMFNDTTYIAKFCPITYTISIDGNGGIVAGEVTQSIVYDSNEIGNFEFESITKEGYTLDGIYNDINKTILLGDASGVLQDDRYKTLNKKIYEIPKTGNEIKVYAGWSGNEYTITYDVDGGNALLESTQIVTSGEREELAIPKKEGYGFDGWFYNGSRVTDSSGIVGSWNIYKDVTLTAHWNSNTYSVTFSNCNRIDPIQFKNGSALNLPTPTRYKYDINPVWKDENGNVYNSGDTMPARDLHLTASWDTQGWDYITSGAELYNKINNNLNGKYCIINDLNLSNGNKNWIPIGDYYNSRKFNGHLDGDGHNLTNLHFNGTLTESNGAVFYGLFGSIGSLGVVENFKLSVSIRVSSYSGNSRDFVGSVFGACFGKVENVIASGSIFHDVYCSGTLVLGGIGGYSKAASIIKCESKVYVHGARYSGIMGGIVGYSRAGIIDSCKHSGDVDNGSGTFAGGFNYTSAVCGASNLSNNPFIMNFSNSGTARMTYFENGGVHWGSASEYKDATLYSICKPNCEDYNYD